MIKIIKVITNLYCIWGRLYRKITIKCTLRYKDFKRAIEVQVCSMSPSQKWNFVLSKMSYKKDTISMLGDVVSDPYISLIRGGDDCDGYAAVSYAILGPSFVYNNKLFIFDGFYSVLYRGFIKRLITKKATGHMIAVWGSQNKYLVISTQTLSIRDSFKEVLGLLQGSNTGQYFVKFDVVDGTPGSNFDMKLEQVYNRNQFLQKVYHDDRFL